MADISKEKLPNLKICIDNTEANSSDEDNLSLKEEGDFEEEERSKKKAPIPQDSSSSDSDDVEFNVRLNRNHKSSNLAERSKKYENKSGDFVTGIDFTKKEEKEKREERAKRFGVKLPEAADIDLEKLYKSLGLKEEDLERRDERGIRLEAVHIRGVDDMNTNDVFNFFQEFAPGSCEWIDDRSCNILWMDRMTAARAMLKLSRSYEEVKEEQDREKEKKKKEKEDRKTEEMKMDTDEPEKSKEELGTGDKDEKSVEKEADKEKDVEERKEEKMEEDDDELDLTEDVKKTEDKDESNKTEETQQEDSKEKKEAKKDTDDKDSGVSEEGELPDSDDASSKSGRRKSVGSTDSRDSRDRRKRRRKEIPWPPGKWRLGVHHPKAKYLFLRYATKADHKLPGAEKRSKFYQKYGNPNYRGMTGLISQSKKRRINAQRFRDERDEARGVVESAHKRSQVSYDSVDMFTDFGVHNYEDVRQIEEKSQPEEEEKSESEESDYYPVVEKKQPKKRARSDGSDDSSVDEEELERLLGSPLKKQKRTMRMYADDVEDQMKEKKRKELLGSLAIVTETRKKPKRVQDARQLITGAGIDVRPEPDIRSRLSARPRSPQRWRRSRSRSRSRSASPDRWERDISPERQRVQLRYSPDSDRASSPELEDLRFQLSSESRKKKGSDLRGRLGKHSKSRKGKTKYPPMKIEVFD